MTSVQEFIPTHGAVAACQILGLPRCTPAGYRSSQRRAAFVGPRQACQARPSPPMVLDVLENQALLDTLNSECFVDTAPAAVHAMLLDESRYLASVRSTGNSAWGSALALCASELIGQRGKVVSHDVTVWMRRRVR